MKHAKSRLRKIGEKPAEKYTMVPNSLIYDRRLRPNTKMVAIYLYAQGDGFQNVGERSVAKALGISSSTVHQAYLDLQAEGWMKRRMYENADGQVFIHEYLIHQSQKIVIPEPSGEPAVDLWG